VRDCGVVADHAAALLKKAGRPQDAISPDTLRLFCKSARFLTAVRYRSIAEECERTTIKAAELQVNRNNNNNNN
jgi:hypothetical protein